MPGRFTPTYRTPIATTGMPSLVVPPAVRRRPRLADRLWDGIAALLLVAGIAAFFYARSALTRIADQTAAPPAEGSWVARTERIDLISRAGLWLVGAGALVGAVSSIRHARGGPMWRGTEEPNASR